LLLCGLWGRWGRIDGTIGGQGVGPNSPYASQLIFYWRARP
jgi:hypothetical protein